MSLAQGAPPGPGVARDGVVARVVRLLPRRSDWSHVHLGRDLVAGVMVGLVALPLALGFGASSGMGAAAGLTTAIVAGALAAACRSAVRPGR
jgi:MFS superfamily sulfate permease-like transporter